MIRETESVAEALQGAVDRGEMSAWFQPQFDVRTERIVALESLCRWRHPEIGMVSPDEFIPVAEDTGMIADIGKFMTRESVAAIHDWGIDVSVNISPKQLEDSRFTGWLERILLRHPFDRGVLTLEVTEGRRIDSLPAVVVRLDRLCRLGAVVSVDDFGSGHASLKQARRLHASELKIDRMLIADDSAENTRALEEIIAKAHKAGIRIVAEGVETAEHYERVVALGCDRAQGYYLGMPAPKADTAKLLANG